LKCHKYFRIIHRVNEIHSQLESKYKPRWLAALLREAINDHAVVGLGSPDFPPLRKSPSPLLLLQKIIFSANLRLS
jgi:hypothetical protein